ncbi:MAG: DUF2726 domain-containing protein [Bacilli bacterium]|nr:DUF2726 domain-containing protein [Bacilli bacterium]
MLNEEKILVINNDKDITKNVVDINDNLVSVNYSDKIYTYNKSNLIIKEYPIIIKDSIISTSYNTLINVEKILKFDNYIKVFFSNNTTKLYNNSEVTIKSNLLSNINVRNVYNYLNEISSYLTIKDISNNEDNSVLSKIYDKLKFINEDSVIKYYVNGIKDKGTKIDTNIFPFSFNLSQKKALNNALNNYVSAIEGQPGTGKTQTILNIISNCIISNYSVAVISNNNSATDNVYEKLKKQSLSSICAKLGKSSNIKDFINNQSNELYPDNWKLNDEEINKIKNNLNIMNSDIDSYLNIKNEIAAANQELDELKTEYNYFKKSIDISNIKVINLPDYDSKKLHEVLMFLNKQKNKKEYFSKLIQIKSKIKYKIDTSNKIVDILNYLEYSYYEKRIKELETQVQEKKDYIKNLNYEKLFKTYTDISMKLFKDYVYKNYNNKKIYDKKTIYNTQELIKDYPVILSTTYSLINCVNKSFMFDYMIIDESSQADLVSSFAALSMAKNVIIVGDSKQLPNIVDKNIDFNEIFNKYDIEEKFNYTKNSLLDLTKKTVNNIVILREHYRCHPKIINFCNKKFYNNELIILSESNNNEPIKQYKSVKGNHARKRDNSWYNLRQAEIIIDELIPNEKIDINKDRVGIITPYKAQKNYLIGEINCPNVSIDTVHGFQGREKDTIIFSTVANNITKFLDNPNSINVAVSRAINKLFLVTPDEYKSSNNSNISNLISYIKYNKFEEVESKINSIFDLLYKVNEDTKKQYLKAHTIFSKFDSETIMYNTIKEILQMDEYSTYDVLDKVYPLRKIVKDKTILNEREIEFINHNSHIDFLIFNKFDKKPVLAIEVDGYFFHNKKKQIIRDQIKNNILKKCDIPLLRFKTNGSREKEIIIKKLNEIIKK